MPSFGGGDILSVRHDTSKETLVHPIDERLLLGCGSCHSSGRCNGASHGHHYYKNPVTRL